MDELESLLRDTPRFEFAGIPEDVHAGRWKWLGEGALRSLVRGHCTTRSVLLLNKNFICTASLFGMERTVSEEDDGFPELICRCVPDSDSKDQRPLAKLNRCAGDGS